MAHNVDQLKPEAFTIQIDPRARAIVTPVGISQAFDGTKLPGPPIPPRSYLGIWDTGATLTMITDRVAQECGLAPIRVTNVETAKGTRRSNVYLVSLDLPFIRRGFSTVEVTDGTINGDVDVLIGMNVIQEGDFAISSENGEIFFSFRCPSVRKIDFADQINKKRMYQNHNRSLKKSKRR